MTSAQLCRRNQWKVGTVLSTEYGGTRTVIQITAIGKDRVLASTAGGESLWDLTARKWTTEPSDEDLLDRFFYGHGETSDRDEILRRMKEGREQR